MLVILEYFPALIECLKLMLMHDFPLSLIITIRNKKQYRNRNRVGFEISKPKPKDRFSNNRNRNRKTDFFNNRSRKPVKIKTGLVLRFRTDCAKVFSFLTQPATVAGSRIRPQCSFWTNAMFLRPKSPFFRCMSIFQSIQVKNCLINIWIRLN